MSSSRAGPAAGGVVITGGSKGLGFAMAREFLTAGDEVLIAGRNSGRLDDAMAALQREYPDGPQVLGIQCDVSRPADMDRLAAVAAEKLSSVRWWINNAGQVTSKQLLADVPSDEILGAANANVIGSLLGCRAAIRVMRASAAQQQPKPSARPCHHIFNLGFSSWGASFSKTAVTHKMTKLALTQLTASLAGELKEAGISYIGVHNLSPGMVLTDLLLEGASPVARRFFNALADEPEVVARNLVPRIRGVQGTGSSIDYLTPLTAFSRVITGLPQIMNGGRFFDRNGERVAEAGQQYKGNGVRRLFDSDSY